jgi:hypothetical protein
MNQFQLDRSVARVTGESVDVIHRQGFSLLKPLLNEADEAGRWLQRQFARLRAHRHQRRRMPQRLQVCAA